MEHTKGNWKVGSLDSTKVWSELPNGMKTCVAWSTNQSQQRTFYLEKDQEEMKANAKLIAASPDLLKALIRCVDRLEENDMGKMFAVTKAKEAINKATL